MARSTSSKSGDGQLDSRAGGLAGLYPTRTGERLVRTAHSRSSSSTPFAHYKLGLDQSLNNGWGEVTVEFLNTDEVENVGSGFQWVTGSKFKILSAAAGKIVRMEVTLALDAGSQDPYFLGSIDRGNSDGQRAFHTSPGNATASGHRHPAVNPSIDPEIYLTFGTTWRAVLDEQHFVSAMQENDNGVDLNLKEDLSFVTMYVVGD